MGFIINPYQFGVAFTGLLDTYSGAAAAYSAARRLSSTYTGSLIRVRRSSDNTEQDIGYDSNNVLDEAALASFVGAGNGFVTTWYDQSGNINNSIQPTASNQPQIVSNGTINKLNNKPTLRFNSFNAHYLYINSSSVLNIQSCISTFSVLNFVNTGGFFGHIMSKGYNDSGVYALGKQGNSENLQLWIETNNIAFSPLYIVNQQYLLSNTNATGTNNIKLYQNGSLYGQSTTTNDLTGSNSYKFSIGRNDRDGSYYLDGNIQEIVTYPTYLESSRTNIESNINTFYSIY